MEDFVKQRLFEYLPFSRLCANHQSQEWGKKSNVIFKRSGQSKGNLTATSDKFSLVTLCKRNCSWR